MAIGLLEFPAMLLTIRDGHGVLSAMAGFDLVTVTSGTAEGQAVPQGARTVDCKVKCKLSDLSLYGLLNVLGPEQLR